MKSHALLLGLFITSFSVKMALAVQVIVPGTSCPWLAGATNGTTASGGDVAPAESPMLVTSFTPGAAIYFSATGSAGFAPGSESGPGGIAGYFVSDPVENGIGGANNLQANELVGVFLDGSVPTSGGPTPPALDFGPFALRDYQSLAPLLNQPFSIGTGKTTNGLYKAVIVPAGATRLFLGICDGSGWFNNPGHFAVDVLLSAAPPILLVRSGTNMELHWPDAYTNCLLQVNANVETTNWVTLTNVPVHAGSDLIVTNGGNATRQFFRLLCH